MQHELSSKAASSPASIQKETSVLLDKLQTQKKTKEDGNSRSWRASRWRALERLRALIYAPALSAPQTFSYSRDLGLFASMLWRRLSRYHSNIYSAVQTLDSLHSTLSSQRRNGASRTHRRAIEILTFEARQRAACRHVAWELSAVHLCLRPSTH